MKYELVCFDLDGTIIDETIFIWHTIHAHLNCDEEGREQGVMLFNKGKISYEEWAKHDIKLWKEQNATKNDILEAIKPIKLMDGALEVLQSLKDAGVKLAIISGSINTALEKVLPNYKDFFSDVFINEVHYADGGKVQDITATKYDMKHKAKGLQYLSEKYNIPLERIAFIGDHYNDVQIAHLAGFSIAFNCKSDELAQVADLTIQEKDLRKILPHLMQ